MRRATILIPQLLLSTVIVPLIIGLCCAIVLAARPWSSRVGSLFVAAAILLIYITLEGLPQFPPIASKQKLFFALAVGGVVISQVSRHWLVSRVIVSLILAFTLLWLAGPRILLCCAPIAVTVFCGWRWQERDSDGFLWPAAILSLAGGGAVLSILGNFVGFGQVLGASAAFIGGLLLVKYVLLLLRPESCGLELRRSVNEVMLFVVLAELLVVGLYAPDLNIPAFVILPLTFLVPLFAPSLPGMGRPFRPFALGAMAALPALLSILFAARPMG